MQQDRGEIRIDLGLLALLPVTIYDPAVGNFRNDAPALGNVPAVERPEVSPGWCKRGKSDRGSLTSAQTRDICAFYRGCPGLPKTSSQRSVTDEVCGAALEVRSCK
jgi:hypothetical protein